MSGGSYNYFCYKVEQELEGKCEAAQAARLCLQGAAAREGCAFV